MILLIGSLTQGSGAYANDRAKMHIPYVQKSMDQTVDKLVARALNRSSETWVLGHTGLDSMTLGKPGHVATQTRAGTANFAVHKTPCHKPVISFSPDAYQASYHGTPNGKQSLQRMYASQDDDALDPTKISNQNAAAEEETRRIFEEKKEAAKKQIEEAQSEYESALEETRVARKKLQVESDAMIEKAAEALAAAEEERAEKTGLKKDVEQFYRPMPSLVEEMKMVQSELFREKRTEHWKKFWKGLKLPSWQA